MAAGAVRREPYIGEKRKFMRNGHGVYVYENQFFRYEGEWKNGKKHGHGKLLMKDGTYYEGQFVNGEINGHGFKHFAGSGCKYTGQFLNGEMHGHGVMQYRDGSIYEGQWHKNKKQGFGILRTSVKSVYQGTFVGHHRNGEGSQTYENGDRYEGYWVMDQRHGHGELFCADGSYYVGQFLHDMYHGDGKMQHSSGMLYIGQWLHGFPTRLASKLVLVVEESPLLIRQGQPFKIGVKCVDDDDNEVVEDQGREIQVSAGFKYFPPKQGSVLFDMIEDVEEKPIPTPFGYEVVSYPITDQLSEEEVVAEDDKGDKSGKDDDGEDKGEGEGEGGDIPESGEGEEEEKEPSGVNVDEGAAADLNPPSADVAPPAGSNPPSPVQEPNPETEGNPPNARAATPVEATPLPPPVSTKRTEGGYVEWSNLQLSPPPPLYRPFVAMDEEKKSSKKMSLKDKFDSNESEESSNYDVLQPDLTAVKQRKARSTQADKPYKGKPKTKKSVSARAECNQSKEKKNSQSKLGDSLKDKTAGVADEKFARTDGTVPIIEEETESKIPIQEEQVMIPEDSGADEVAPPTMSQQIKLLIQEKEPHPGEYVLMVHDVTTPPFLGKHLEPAFLLLKLKRPKKIIVKKPNDDHDQGPSLDLDQGRGRRGNGQTVDVHD